ncbi:MAG: hypothetical protein HQM16_02040 [Deltaproteobacteria bacterium]|nr:hypothetical protein [Deltaproteobacteria bacterium]
MKIGIVPYINALPLSYFLENNQIIKMYPSELAAALLNGTVDCALLPLYSIIKHKLRMHPDAGIIACDGDVGSVGFYTRSYIENLSQIQSIYMDKESLSSVYLAKIILKKFYGVSLYDLEFFHYDNREMADAQLLIGDKVLFSEINSSLPYKFWDIGSVWKQNTGAGFMFASWASQRALTPAEIAVLKNAKTAGLAHIDHISSTFNKEQRGLVNDYLTNSIIYEPTPAIKDGLRLYKDYLKEYQYSEPRKLKVA